MNARLIIFLLLSFITSLYIGIEVAQGNFKLVGSLVAFIAIPLAIFSIRRDISFSFKIIMFMLIGYALGSKGFAYLAVAEPFYPSEMVLTLLIIIAILTFPFRKSSPFCKDRVLNTILIIYLIYGGINLLFYLGEYKMYALRDAATVYYSLYFFLTYYFCRNREHLQLGLKVFGICVVFSLFTKLLVSFWPGVNMAASGFALRGKPLIHLHVDTMIMFTAAAAAFCFIKLKNRAAMKWLVFLIIALMGTIFGSKTVFILALLCSAIYMAQIGYKLYPVVLGFSGIIVLMMLLVGAAVNFEPATVMVERLKKESSAVSAADISAGMSDAYGDQASTTEWRISWWRQITEDTFKENPILGMGLGADLETNFVTNYWGYTSTNIVVGNMPGATRYPHNIIFTILGRLGLLGVVIFTIVIFRMGAHYMEFARMSKYVKWRAIEVAIVIATISGLINAFVQATFEIPFAAIPYWVLLAMSYRMVEFKKEDLAMANRVA